MHLPAASGFGCAVASGALRAALAAEDRGVIHLKAFDLPVQEEQLVITAAGIRALGEVLARGYLEGR